MIWLFVIGCLSFIAGLALGARSTCDLMNETRVECWKEGLAEAADIMRQHERLVGPSPGVSRIIQMIEIARSSELK